MSSIASGRLDTFDPDEHAESTSPWEVSYTQISSGKFRGRTEFVSTEGLIVYRERWNRRLAVAGQSPSGYHMFGAPVYDAAAYQSEEVTWCGRDLARADVAYTRPAAEVDILFSDVAHHVAVLVRSSVLARYLGEVDDTDAAHSRYIHHHPQQVRRFIAMLDSIVTRYINHPDLANDAGEGEALESEVLGALSQIATWGPDPAADYSRRRNALRHAIGFINSEVGPVTVPQLAEVAGVSQRTLEYAFREQMGITPVQFLRRYRMNRARGDLSSAAPRSTTVTAVAGDWGFSDLGRFAADYREMFGEPPSRALARRKATPVGYLGLGRRVPDG